MRIQIPKPLHESFNDGVLIFGYDRTIREQGKKVDMEFQVEGKLAFKLMNARDQDYEFAGMMNASLDLKVKTLFPPSFREVRKSNLKVVIEDIKYDVIKVNWDSDKRYLYFYLQEVGAK